LDFHFQALPVPLPQEKRNFFDQSNSLIYKYFTSKSLFLKDLTFFDPENPAKSLIPKDHLRRGMNERTDHSNLLVRRGSRLVVAAETPAPRDIR